MTFDEWWDSTGTTATPDTYKGWEESCRQAWEAGTKTERDACAKVCGDAAFSASIWKAAVNEDGSEAYNHAALDCAIGALEQCSADILERSNAELTGRAAEGREGPR